MANTKYFSFVDRFLPIHFFEEEPVTVTLTICDQMDKKIDDTNAKYQKLNSAEEKRQALVELIGEENVEKICSRFEEVDSYVLDQILLYILAEYVGGKRKNLQAAAAGRQKMK